MRMIILCMLTLLIMMRCKEKITPSATTETFKVWGNCGMCESTIEGSLKADGIFKADWNQETKMIVVAYDTTKYSLQEVHKKIASSGYDTELENGDDQSYKSLPDCCQYERKMNQ